MAGWLHGVFVGDWLFVFPLCGFSLSLFCNYLQPRTMLPGPLTRYSAAGPVAWPFRPAMILQYVKQHRMSAACLQFGYIC